VARAAFLYGREARLIALTDWKVFPHMAGFFEMLLERVFNATAQRAFFCRLGRSLPKAPAKTPWRACFTLSKNAPPLVCAILGFFKLNRNSPLGIPIGQAFLDLGTWAVRLRLKQLDGRRNTRPKEANRQESNGRPARKTVENSVDKTKQGFHLCTVKHGTEPEGWVN
jgi:hypothetical protein